jgi:hypothetical protein
LFAPVHPASSLYWTDLLDDPIPEKNQFFLVTGSSV